MGLLLSPLWGVLTRRRDRPVAYGRAAQPLTRQHAYRDQPPATDDRRVYQGQPPV